MVILSSCVQNGSEKSLLKFIPSANSPNAASPGAGNGGVVANANSLYFTDFMGVVKSKCLSCHSSDSNGNFALLQTEEAWLKSGFVTSGDITSSSLYLSLKDANAAGTMPKNLPALSASEIKKVKDWIEKVQVGNSGPTGNGGVVNANSFYFTNFKDVVKSKCLSCHSSDINGNFAVLQTEEAWLKSGFITSGDISSSSFYQSLKGPNPSGTMPKNAPALIAADIKIVKDWIENIQFTESGFSGISVRLGNRNYVNSVINFVFGKSNTTAIQSGTKYKTLSEKIILYNPSIFQGSCDIFSVRVNSAISLSYGLPPDLNDDWCSNEHNRIADVMVPIIGRTNSVRHGFLTQVCEGQVGHVASLEYAMTTHNGWVSGDLPVTNENLEKAFQSFYPEKPIPVDFRTALLEVASAAPVNKNKWKWIYLTICLSSEWQVP